MPQGWLPACGGIVALHVSQCVLTLKRAILAKNMIPVMLSSPLATQTNPVFSPYIQCSVTRQVIQRWIRDCLLYNSQIALAARPLTKWCLRFQITLYHYCSEFGIIIGCQGRAPISEFLSVLGRPDLGWLMAWHCMVPGQHQLRPGQDCARLWLVSKVYPVKVQLMWYGILENHIHSDFGFMGAEWVWVCVCTYVGTPRIEYICTHDMPRE